MTAGAVTARRPPARAAAPWAPLAALVLAQIGYPLTAGDTRATLVVATVVLGYAVSVLHAARTRGARTAVALVVVTTGGGLAVEALGVHTGVPFGAYAYLDTLGPKVAGVPLIIPLAWTWMAWPAWLAAIKLVGGAAARTTAATHPTDRPTATAPATATAGATATARATRTARVVAARVAVAGVGLAAWDLFLDPQMVAERYWTWTDPHPALPGVPGIPIGNYLGWLAVALPMIALFAAAAGPRAKEPAADAPMYALYLWTYASSILAHAVFLDLPASAAWGAIGMGTVAIPLAVRLWRSC